MSFPLKNLEFYIDEYVFVLGEKLLEEGKVKNLQEAEKHLWIAEVEANEVEIQISPSKIIAYTCECSFYLKEKVCGHIVSTLLLLRKSLSEQKNTQKKRRKAKRIPKKLTTAVILDQIPHDELMIFVRQYAKSNRNFSIALKAHFATAVTLNDNKDKYFQVLETTLSAARRQDRSIGSSGVKKIAVVLEEILAQAEDELARDYFADTLIILQAVIEKITPVLSKVEDTQDILLGKIIKAFDLMEQVLKNSLAPSLKKELWEYCLQESQRIVYWRNDLVRFFHQILLQLAETDKQKSLLIKYVDQLLYTDSKYQTYTTALLLLKLHLLENTHQLQKAQTLVKKHLGEVHILLHATQQAMKKKNYQRAKYLALEGLELFPKKNIQNRLMKILLQLALKEEDIFFIEKYARQLLLSSLKVAFFKILKQNIPENWTAYRGALLDKLQLMPYSIQKRDLIAIIYAEEACYEQLLEYIASLRSLDLLSIYDTLLFPHYKKEVYQLYEDFLTSYLKNHLGRKTSQKVRAIIQHLYQVGARDLAEHLVDLCRGEYQERQSLMEELELF